MEESEKIRSEQLKQAISFSTLGTQIKFSPKAKVEINRSGMKTEYFVETVSILVGIGKDNTAELIMDKDAWFALNQGEEVYIETYNEFAKKNTHPSKKKKL